MSRPPSSHARVAPQHRLLPLVLAASSGLSVALFLVRHQATGSLTFFFLNWNLLLAWVPLLCAALLWRLQRGRAHPRTAGLPVLAIWLLFFPNAPYILTDLLHLDPREGIPLWYDLLLLLSYAWNGLIVGFASLWIVHRMVDKWYGAAAGWVAAAGALAAAAVGVYLGRFERWNSWDLLLDPGPIVRSVVAGLLDPVQNLHALAAIGLFGSLLTAMYVTLTLLQAPWDARRNPPPALGHG